MQGDDGQDEACDVIVNVSAARHGIEIQSGYFNLGEESRRELYRTNRYIPQRLGFRLLKYVFGACAVA